MKSDLGTSALLTSNARILRADNGSEIAVDELAASNDRPAVWTLNARGRLVASPVEAVSVSGLCDAFTMRLASGRTLAATASTRFRTLDGWNPLSKLQIDERLAVPRRIPRPLNSEQMEEAEIILLAHMIGDGSCVRGQPIRYASVDEQNLRAVAHAAKHFGVTAVRDDYPAARVTTLRLPAPYHLTHGKRNPIAAWLDGYGLFGKRS